MDKTIPKSCELCGLKIPSLLPYGPNREYICANCGLKDFKSYIKGHIKDTYPNYTESHIETIYDFFKEHPAYEKMRDVLKRSLDGLEECELCGTMDVLRPFGPNNEKICVSCGMKNPEATIEKVCEFEGVKRTPEEKQMRVQLYKFLYETAMEHNERIRNG